MVTQHTIGDGPAIASHLWSASRTISNNRETSPTSATEASRAHAHLYAPTMQGSLAPKHHRYICIINMTVLWFKNHYVISSLAVSEICQVT